MSAGGGTTTGAERVRINGHEVVTVTANPAVDQTVWIPGFQVGEVNRVRREVLTPGGKGVNVAAFLAGYGVPVVATGFLGTANARMFEDFFAVRGIVHRFVPVQGTTRTGVKIVDDETGATTDVNFPGFTVEAADATALGDRVAELAAPGRWLVLAGSLPPGAPTSTYRTLAELAHERGALVAVDTSGPALREALAAGPDLVKPNRAELEELTGRTLPDRASLLSAARELLDGGVGTVVVSLGADGALFARADEAVVAEAPVVPVASTVGAGDAMVAGTIAGTRCALPLPEVAALATAFSAAAIGRIGRHLEAAAVDETADAVVVAPVMAPVGTSRRRTGA